VLRRLSSTTTLLIYAQILLGATMRHTGAGMAIPTFPLAFGHVLPPVWTPAIAVHFAHRVGALLVLGGIFATAAQVSRYHRGRPDLMRPALLLVLLVCSQATLGALVVLSGLQPVINTLHVVTGALVLGTSLVLTLRVHKRAAVQIIEPRRSRTSFASEGLPAVTKNLRSLGGLRDVRR